MFSLGWNLDPDIDGHPGVLHEGRGVDVCAVPTKDVKLDNRLPALGCIGEH